MTQNQYKAQPRGLSNFRWGRLSIRVKLLLPVLLLMIVSLIVVLALLIPPITAYTQNSARANFAYHLESLDGHIQNFLQQARSGLLNIVNIDKASDIFRSPTDTTSTQLRINAENRIQTQLISDLGLQSLPYARISVVGKDGQYVLDGRYDVSSKNTALTPDTALPKQPEDVDPILTMPLGQVLVLPSSSTQEVNPDINSPELLITLAAPIYDYQNNAVDGAVIASFHPREILQTDLQPDPSDTTQVVLLDNNNTPIAVTNPTFDNQTAPSEPILMLGNPQLKSFSLPSELPLQTDQNLLPVGSRLYSSTTIENVSGFANLRWSLVISEDRGTLFASAADLQNKGIAAVFILVVIMTIVLVAAGRQITEPLVQLSQTASRVAGGDFKAQVAIVTDDELGQVAAAFNAMGSHVSELVGTLEQRVAERTRNIEIVAEISRDAVQARDINQLLQRTVNAIRERFDFYHAQVFLVDDLRQYAVLVTSTGEAGKILLERKHKLAIGSASIVGQVTEKGRTFITLDTETSEVPHRFNPVLPKTRSEMALPLKLANVVIGALDIQSVEANAFSQGDVEIFGVLADQIAIAIDNARLIDEAERRIRQIDDLNRQLTRTAWAEYVQTRGEDNLIYKYDLMNVNPASEEELPPGLSAEIKVRGETVGNLTVFEGPDVDLSEEDRTVLQSVADRVALAVENIRLVEQTQSALAEIERLYTASRALSSAGDLNAIYDITANYLATFEFMDRMAILRAVPDPVIWPQYVEYVYMWNREPQDATAGQLTGRIPTEALQLDKILADPRKPEIVPVDPHLLGDALYASFRTLKMETVLAAPLTTGSHWFGLILCSSKRTNVFTQNFAQFVSAIADQIAIVIDNRRLFEEAQIEARRNRALAEAVQISSQIGGDFEAGIGHMFHAVGVPAGYDRWWFGLLEGVEGQSVLRRVTSHFTEGSSLYTMARIQLSDEANALAEAARLNQLVVINDPEIHHELSKLTPEKKRSFGKHIAMPIRIEDRLVGAFMIGRALNEPDLDERDLQFINTLASQIVVALSNQRLFNAAETGRQTLQSVLNSLPTGVMVVDATGQTSLTNQLVRDLLGLDEEQPHERIRTSTGSVYDPDEFPPIRALLTQQPIFAEDMSVVTALGDRTDLIVNAAPVMDAEGNVVSAVAVFQDVTELRELENVLQESLRETTTLYEASRAIAAERDLSNILNVLTVQLTTIIQFDNLYAVFRDEQGNISQTFFADLTGDLRMYLVEGPCPIPRMILRDAEVFIENTVALNPSLANNPQIKELGIASIGAFPLNARSRTIGWLVMGFSENKMFSPEERRLLTTLADQAAVALESARLAEATSQALSETKLLYEASFIINRTTNIAGAVEAVRDQLKYFAPSQIDIFLISSNRGESGTLDWLVHWDATDTESRGEVHATSPIFEDATILEGRPYFVDDVALANDDIKKQIRKVPNWEHITAEASVPLGVKGRVTGRLVIGFNRPYQFGRFERQFITTLADQAAIVIDNSALIQQTQDSLEEIGTLYESSRAITDAPTSAEILQGIVDHAAQPFVTRAWLMRLMSDSWDRPTSTVEMAAEWNREEGVQLSGVMYGPDQLPFWSHVSHPELTWIEDLSLDTKLDEAARETYMTNGMQAVVSVPLSVAGRPVGALLFGAIEPWPMTERELRIFKSLGDQAAISIENRNLLEQAEKRARQLQLSAEVAQAATSILNLNELFDRTVNLIKDSFNYDHAQIFLVTDDGTDAQLVASTGEPGRQLLAIHHHLLVGSASVIGQVTSTGKPQIASNVSERGVVHKPNPYLPNTKSEMALPLLARNRILGALDVQSNLASAFTPEDQDVLANLANQIAVAIDNARLFELSSQRVEEMRFLFDVTRAATSIAGESEEAINKISQLILDSLKVNSVIFMLAGENPDLITVFDTVIQSDGGLLFSPGHEINMHDYWFPDLFNKRSPLIINDVAASGDQVAKSMPHVGSAVYVPMLAGENLIGMIGVTRQETNAFNEGTAQLLQTLAPTLAAIYQNARLLSEVQAANTRLREVDKLKSQFLANMSHELRTPLNSIIGFSRVILKGIDGALTPMQEQDLATIHESGKHLLNLVNDILDQAKIEAGKMELSYGYFSIAELVKSVMSTAVGLVKDKPVRLHQEVEPDLPNVYGDEFRSRQVLLNLISNAAKFTAQGSVTASAFRVVENDKPMVQVSVTDTGIGIPADKLDSVFEAFQQVENSTARQYEGTGLGLPIAKSLIEMQGGRIWVDSEPGVGSTFSFTVPFEPSPEQAEEKAAEAAAQAPTAEATPLTQPQPQPAAAAPAQPVTPPVSHEATEPVKPEAAPVSSEIAEQVVQVIEKAEIPKPKQRIVLAIDDELGMVNLYRRYLAKAGYEVIGGKPEEAEELAETYKPSVILLDVNMPNRSGWDVLAHLKDRDQTFEIPVIICSIDSDKERAFRLGASDYLVKSIDEQTLIEAVKRAELERDCRKILIIDDQPESIRLIRDALTNDDRFRVFEAVGGAQGLDMVCGHWPDLIILDLRMPEMDGIEVFERLQSDQDMSQIPVLIITADDLTDDERVRLSGATIYRKQTVNAEELLQSIVAQLSW